LTSPKTIDTQADWKSEMNRIATKHHVIVCWVAIIINPLSFILDYLTIPGYWKIFFVIRIVVAAITLLAVVLRKKINISTELLMLIPYLGISLQNAYMWSVMDVPMLQKHTFAYITLFIGGGMLVLWKPIWSIGTVVLSLIANIIFLGAFSPLSSQEILVNGGTLVATVAIISVVLIHTRYVLTKKEIIARLALSESNKELAMKNEMIEEKNRDITASITYAKRLQEAILPPTDYVKQHLPDSFILYKPKDIVAGDFHWMFSEETPREGQGASEIFVAAADCTGHGVPGAIVSVVCSNALNRTVKEFGLRNTGKILDKVTELVLETFEKSDKDVKDGMDISLLSCKMANGKWQMEWSGANNPLWYIQNGIVNEITPDKQPIGKHDNRKPFTTHQLPMTDDRSPITFYLFTDGYADQFGGAKRKKLKYKQLQEKLSAIYHLPMEEQRIILEKTFDEWKGNLEQVDDVLIIGIRI